MKTEHPDTSRNPKGDQFMSDQFTGGCACGAVRYSIAAGPIMVGHCQCGKCQKLSGTGHGSFAAFPAAAVSLSGELRPWSYRADSGNTSTRSHCPTCGTQVTGGNSGMPDILAVSLATLDDPSLVAPSMVFFHDRAQPWDVIDANLPTFPGMPPM
jgi:hypothetical protein